MPSHSLSEQDVPKRDIALPLSLYLAGGCPEPLLSTRTTKPEFGA